MNSKLPLIQTAAIIYRDSKIIGALSFHRSEARFFPLEEHSCLEMQEMIEIVEEAKKIKEEKHGKSQ